MFTLPRLSYHSLCFTRGAPSPVPLGHWGSEVRDPAMQCRDLRCVGGLGQPSCCPHANLGVCSRGQGSRPRCVCPWWLNVSEGDLKDQHCLEETLPQSSPAGSGLQLLSIIPISCVAAFISFQISLATFAPPGFVRDDFPHRRRVHFLFYLPSAQLL